ncbi:MAG: L-serine ammonia-lyase, iron-sulfur-dependent, subunit alpha, partial [Paeniclostridium sordellii]|nr:L-serine ammonia-lyase, iron-sulfur-dependent, subunit alpha [Paeniclostridium sordellii]
PFDETVEAMYKVGRGLPMELRETALGGVAATCTGNCLTKKIFG